MGSPTEKEGAVSQAREVKSIPWEEVEKHNTTKDCWVVVDDLVYDVSKFLPYHPGGRILSRYGGMDATDTFYAFHGEEEGSPGMKALPRYLVGKIANPRPVKEHLQAFRDLRKQVAAEGLMRSNKFWFTRVFCVYLAAYAFAIYLLYALPRGWLTTIFSAWVLGITWGQGGLLQHDLGHAAVFFDCKMNEWAHIFFYGVFMGGSPEWWKGRHTRHHASPNHGELDLDIRTLPLFAWDKKQFKKAYPNLVKYQWIYWTFIGPPVLLIVYRILNAFFMVRRKNFRECISVLLHFLLLNTCIWSSFQGDLVQWFTWHVLVLAWGGAYLGWVFALNHYMFPIYREADERDWLTATMSTTQNISPSLFMDYLTGHLDYQVEHHLWPRMPRHNYEVVHPRLKALCDKYNIPFYESPFFEAIGQVMGTLIHATKPEEPVVDPSDFSNHANDRKSVKVTH